MQIEIDEITIEEFEKKRKRIDGNSQTLTKIELTVMVKMYLRDYFS